jgi:hypothetical protein
MRERARSGAAEGNMKKKKKKASFLKKIRRDDLVAVLCALFIAAVAIFNAASGAAGRQAGVADSEVPAGALTLTGVGQGRNGDITVQIAADGVNPQQLDAAGRVLEGQSVKPGGNSTTFIILLIIAGAALTVMITILAVTSIRTRRERMKRMAAEKQRIKDQLGRTGSFPAVKGGRPPRRPNDRSNAKKGKH